ncbi:DUF1156 domain-containing protein [Nannocystis sp. SCPEA4]|uniref:DUF1156 domain-containing protein n=1 Tax=Nannocystis sp. SCPEA4 TaxID=2996787 RepID=UPI00227190E9|nr:DUF1156 domain-containing protein [Nannocystis sp. SCPEA4]MCY1060708.1 DUF1156 domain-containing protein [Nannocystis sp. SCPEA4]
MTTYRKKLIEVALPLDAINEASAREKSIRQGHPSTLHLWWARRPLAAARAVLFGQLVDDPSAWPALFPTEDAQEAERQRLFDVIRDFVPWDATNNQQKLDAARLEIARSWARNHPSNKSARILAPDCTSHEVNVYLASELPPVHDPFAGGGTIPLEAQRLGLRAVATDLNPVAVLINKALIEIPPRFADQPPVNPEARKKAGMRVWRGAEGLAEDLRHYGAWIRQEARKRLAHLYPEVPVTRAMAKGRPDLKEYEGKTLTVVAWLWARTVASPNPALGGVHVPLVSSYWLYTRKGKETWLEPVSEKGGRSYRFEIRTGTPDNEEAIGAGTKSARGGNFRCLLSDAPIPAAYVRAEGAAGRLGTRLLAVACAGERERVFLPASSEQVPEPVVSWAPEFEFAKSSRYMTPCVYGLDSFAKLFLPRQLCALNTFASLVSEARAAFLRDTEGTLTERADALSLYLTLALGRLVNRSSTLCFWDNGAGMVQQVFARQALSMTWDFCEGNPISDSSGNFYGQIEYLASVLDASPLSVREGQVAQADAREALQREAIISTDPPYYDNVPYADLSDFFYVWLRRAGAAIFPDLFRTMLVPKADELVMDPLRQGDERAAEAFFTSGMSSVLRDVCRVSTADVPTAIYYAFRQGETSEAGTSSTGWETFLSAVVASGLTVVGTWPIRTELVGNLKKQKNVLASSVVLICRKREDKAATITRSDFRRLLRAELPAAVKALQHGNIAPVDLAQASIGPGMAIFSRHATVMEADGTPMSVRSALQLINEALDEYLTAQEGEADADTRFALTWFETNGWSVGNFGDAETLAKARNISVAGIVESGILHSAAGKVRLLKRSEMLAGWDPRRDDRVPVWEATQHLIRRLEEQGEAGAAALRHQLGPLADHAHDLAYRLYSICERKGWAEDARAYNGLVTAWPEISRLAAAVAEAPPTAPGQIGLGLVGADPPAAKKKPAARKPRKSA